MSQANNVQEFFAAAHTKRVAMYRAIQENTYRPFTDVDEFLDYIKTASTTERNRVLAEVTAYANKAYNDVMGM